MKYANTHPLRNTTSQSTNGYTQKKNLLNVKCAKSHFLRYQDAQSTDGYIQEKELLNVQCVESHLLRDPTSQNTNVYTLERLHKYEVVETVFALCHQLKHHQEKQHDMTL